jgi:membrane protease YdiL (CAAX protease family)
MTPNPFAQINIRTLLLLLIVTFPFTLVIFALSKKIIGFDDALVEGVTTALWFYGIIMLWIWYQFKKRSISWKALIGSFPEHFNWFANAALLLCMLAFNFGSLLLSVGLISYIFPDFAVGFMNDQQNTQTVNSSLFLVFDTIAAIVIAPIVEELIMRGVFLHRFKYKWGINKAIIIAGMIFAVGHSNILGMFMVALILSILYLKYNSLLIPMFFHAMNNTTVSLLQLSAGNSNNAPKHLTTLSDIQSLLWFGLALVVISSPVLMRFLIKNWPQKDLAMPYEVNLKRRLESPL